MKKIVVIDYGNGNGNGNSIKNALADLGESSIYSSRLSDVASANYIILPGVGHYGASMNSLYESGLIDTLYEAVMIKKVPVLGICLGMQLMTEFSEEGSSAGMGWVKGKVHKMSPDNPFVYKIPHIGWNTVNQSLSSILLNGIDVNEEPFYFCHAYAIDGLDTHALAAYVEYDRPYLALFELKNIFGVQFHPEKSQDCGLQLIQNFLRVDS